MVLLHVFGMGNINSSDTRRISFENNFALSPALAVENSVEANINDVLEIENLPGDDSSDHIFKENNKTLDEADPDYWSQRLEALKKEHLLINKIVETEYEKTAETARKYYEVPNITPERILKIKPCFDWRSKILQCYEDNPHQPLVCSGVVQAFSSCVASCRAAKD